MEGEGKGKEKEREGNGRKRDFTPPPPNAESWLRHCMFSCGIVSTLFCYLVIYFVVDTRSCVALCKFVLSLRMLFLSFCYFTFLPKFGPALLSGHKRDPFET